MIRRVTDVRDAALASFRAIGDPAALERDGLFVAESRLIVERLVSDRSTSGFTERRLGGGDCAARAEAEMLNAEC